MKRKRRKMSETPAPAGPEVVKEKVDLKNDLRLEIMRAEDGNTLSIYIRAPVLADIIRKMAPGNYRTDEYAAIYKPVLATLVDPATGKEVSGRCITRPAITKATKLFVSGTDFLWEEPPRAILVANPDKLAEGFTLTYKMEKPVSPDVMRRWGKNFIDGCADIISNSRPFKMSWVAEEAS